MTVICIFSLASFKQNMLLLMKPTFDISEKEKRLCLDVRAYDVTFSDHEMFSPCNCSSEQIRFGAFPNNNVLPCLAPHSCQCAMTVL